MIRRTSSFRLPMLALTASLLAPAAALAQESVTLAYKWTKGSKLYYKWTEEAKTKISGSEAGDLTGGQSRVSYLAFDVKDVGADGVATIQATYEGVTVESQQPHQGLVVYDSTRPESADLASPLTSVFTAFIGQSFTFTMDPTGHVKKVEGVNKILEHVTAANANYPSSTVVINTLKDNDNDTTFVVKLERVFTGLPTKAVKPGDTWTDTFDFPVARFGSLKADRKFTLKELVKGDADQVAVITGEYKVALNQPKEGDPAAMIFSMVKPVMSDGGGTAERRLGVKAGRLENSTVNVTSTIDWEIPSGAGAKGKNVSTYKYIMERIDTPPKRPPAPAPAAPSPKPVPAPGGAPDTGVKPGDKK